MEQISKFIIYPIVGTCIGTISLPVIVAATPFLLGFTVNGIVTGSIAAVCMSYYAGFVPAGGLVAIMQRIGTMGIYAGFNRPVMIVGACCGFIGGIMLAIGYNPIFV